jgi:hypothetical protein
MRDSTVARFWIACTLVQLLCCARADEGGEKRKAMIVRPCPTAPRVLPIIRQCVAAAIAEDAFLGETHRPRGGGYLITAMKHSPEQWKFMILGSDTHPSAAGSDWMVVVERHSGKVELIPGK